MLKFFLISGIVTYLFMFIFYLDIRREFKKRYNRSPIRDFKLSKEISGLILCFIPFFNIMLILTVVFNYNKTVEMMINEMLEKEEKYNK